MLETYALSTSPRRWKDCKWGDDRKANRKLGPEAAHTKLGGFTEPWTKGKEVTKSSNKPVREGRKQIIEPSLGGGDGEPCRMNLKQNISKFSKAVVEGDCLAPQEESRV